MRVTKHTQVVQFESGDKKTFMNIVEVVDGEMVKLTDESGVEFLINREKILWVSRDTNINKGAVSSSQPYF